MKDSFAKGTRRVAEAVDFVAQSRIGSTSRQIIEQLAVPRSSGYDLLNGLLERQFLHRRSGGNWVLGDEFHALAMSRFGLGAVATEIPTVLTVLQEQTQETAQLVVPSKTGGLVTHVYRSLRSMPLGPEIGIHVPVNWSKLGGHSVETEHSEPSVASIAAPVMSPRGICVAAVRLILPVARMLNCQDSLVSLVQTAAAKLTHGLATQK